MASIRDYVEILEPIPIVIKKLLVEVPACADPDLIYGTELEIENLPRDYDNYTVPHMSVVADDSLRNHGREFLTAPMRYRELVYTLDQFFKKNKFTSDNYSERCSTHVHVNCLDLSVETLCNVLFLYQIFERVLYNFVGNNRDKNIFCVPWYDTILNHAVLPKLLEKGLSSLKSWQKYTGLNLLPLFKLGTVEFRHMAGTNDIKQIKDWLNIIGCLFRYAKSHSIVEIKQQVLDLNTTSRFSEITDAVFGKYADLLKVNNYKDALENGVIILKYSLVNDKRPNELSFNDIRHPHDAAAQQAVVQAYAQPVDGQDIGLNIVFDPAWQPPAPGRPWVRIDDVLNRIPREIEG